MQKKGSLALAHFWVWLSYLLAIGAGIYTVYMMPNEHTLIRLLAADVVGTLVIFIFSVLFKNSSFYDPYWSVIPIVLGFGMIWIDAVPTWNLRQLLVMGVVIVYGIRLTYNWARGWTGLDHEDWRYIDLQKKTGKAYWVVSFLGIHLMPTILVFLGCMPLWWALSLQDQPLHALEVVGVLVSLGAVIIEGTADNQLRKFRLNQPPKGSIMNQGLWAYSRHPNYFGEILFWWGLALLLLPSGFEEYWWLGFGAPAITGLFVFISLPMIDKRMLGSRPGYHEHKKRVSAIIPWFPKS